MDIQQAVCSNLTMVRIFKGLGLVVVAFAGVGLFGACWGAAVDKDPSLFPVVGFMAVIGIGIFGLGSWLERREKLAAGRPLERLPVLPQVFSGAILLLQMALVLVAGLFTLVTAMQLFAKVGGRGTISMGPPLGMAISVPLIPLAHLARRKLLRSRK